jgi:hypothetical protein
MLIMASRHPDFRAPARMVEPLRTRALTGMIRAGDRNRRIALTQPAFDYAMLGAGNEARTRDPQLGKLMLYQLSYARSRR